jgi:hypothetical protein
MTAHIISEFASLGLMEIVGPIISGSIFVAIVSLVREPARK